MIRSGVSMILQDTKLRLCQIQICFFCPPRCQKQLEQIGQKIQKARPACHSVHDLKVGLITVDTGTELTCRLVPQMFGYPCRRSRHYRITWDPQRLAWSLAAWPSTLVHASQKIGFLTCLSIWRLCVWLRTGSSKNWSRWFCFHPQLCQLYRPALFLSVILRKTLSSVKRIWPGLTVSLMIVRSQHYWCWKVNYALPFFLDFECDVAGIRRLTWHATGPNLKDQSSSRCPRTRSRGRGWRTKTHTGQPWQEKWIFGFSSASQVSPWFATIWKTWGKLETNFVMWGQRKSRGWSLPARASSHLVFRVRLRVLLQKWSGPWTLWKHH